MPIPLYQVDAFASGPFSGNPAAVCLLEKPARADWMQRVAQEMNLAETAFVEPAGERFKLRWFTPAVEVDLCGHATLASAPVLWEAERLALDRSARFETRSGELTCRRADDWIEMDFPATPALEAAPPPGLIEALGETPIWVGGNSTDFLVQLESAEKVRALRPDFRALQNLKVRGVIVTARSGVERYDFISRFFAPGSGIDEDSATGSAHCTLCPFWAEHLGKNEMLAFQASARGAEIGVVNRGDRIVLRGEAVTVLRGDLLV